MVYIKKNQVLDIAIKGIAILGLLIFIGYVLSGKVYANSEIAGGPFSVNIDLGSEASSNEVVNSLKILFILTIISLAPSIIIMMTSFTRIIVVLHFLRSALGTQQTPPNQVLVGLALFLTLFIMSPTIKEVNENAIVPYSTGEINQKEAMEKGMEPLREFMFKQVDSKDLKLFMDIAKIEVYDFEGDYPSAEVLPSSVLIPSFVISELRKAFIIGFIIYMPFIVIDMVVASTLMAMGMMMLPPVMISLPFKILLFVLVDGWNLIIGQLVNTFS